MSSSRRTKVRIVLMSVMVASLLAMPLAVTTMAQTDNSTFNKANPQALQDAFEDASKEFDVPLSILMSVAYNETRWDHHDGQPSTSGGYGVMHLTQVNNVSKISEKGDKAEKTKRSEEPGLHTLDKAATLLKVDPEVLKQDPAQNIRGGAALLADYARQTVGTTPADPADWYGAVAKYSGSDNETVAKGFADRVYATIQQGAERTLQTGQRVVLEPKQVTPDKRTADTLKLHKKKDREVDCPKGLNCELIPAAYEQFSNSPHDYGNYDLANRPEDGLDIRYIIIHDTEGSFSSAVNWFQAQSYASAQYVIRSSDGHVAQMVKNDDVAWQAGNWYINTHSIGLEHEGYAVEGATWYSEEMYHASAKLVSYLAKKYDIPLDRQHILGHDELPGTSPATQTSMHWDPGAYWDWAHYFNLVRGSKPKQDKPKPDGPPWKQDGIVTIDPNFRTNKPPLTYGDRELQPQPSNFVYLHAAPDFDAPLISDPALHPDGEEGTTNIYDWGDKAVTGRSYYQTDRQGDWSAIYYGGQKAWFYNPHGKNTDRGSGMLVTPKEGRDSIPVYGTAWPEESAYEGTGIPESGRGTISPLQYTISAGQMYVATGPFKSDYYYAKLYNAPETNQVVKGEDEYYQISFNHRIAFVKKSDVDIVDNEND